MLQEYKSTSMSTLAHTQASIPSFLFNLLEHLEEENAELLQPYKITKLQYENRAAYLLGFNILPDEMETSFFKGYKLVEHHLRVDSYHSNARDWLSLAHDTLVYENENDGTKLTVHVHFNKRISLWSVRAKKQVPEGEGFRDERLELDPNQIKIIIQFSEKASLLLQVLLSQYAKRHLDALKETEELEEQLSKLSAALQSFDGRNAYREKAEEFMAALAVSNAYGDPTKKSSELPPSIRDMLELLDRIDQAANSPSIVEPDSEHVEEETGSEIEPKPSSVQVLATPQQLAQDQGMRLYADMQGLLKQVQDLSKKIGLDFFQSFHWVDDLRLKVAECIFSDSDWIKIKKHSKIIKNAKTIISEVEKQRKEIVKHLFEEKFSESMPLIFDCLSKKEHQMVLALTFYHCVVVGKTDPNKKNSEDHLKILDWYFQEKNNFYQSFLKMLECIFLKNKVLFMSFLFSTYVQHDFYFFRTLLEHGLSPNGLGIKMRTSNASSYSLLRSIVAYGMVNKNSDQYISLLIEYGAFLDCRPTEVSLDKGYVISQVFSEEDDINVDELVELMKNSKHILNGPSDFVVGVLMGNYTMPKIFMEQVSLASLTVGLSYLSRLKTSVARMVIGSHVSGIECYRSMENAQDHMPKSVEESNEYGIRHLLILGPQFFSFGARVLEHFKEKARTKGAIDKTIKGLYTLAHNSSDDYPDEITQIILWGSIELLISQRTELEYLTIDNVVSRNLVKKFIEAEFEMANDYAKYGDKQGMRKPALNRIFFLPKGLPEFSEFIKSLGYYKVVAEHFRSKGIGEETKTSLFQEMVASVLRSRLTYPGGDETPTTAHVAPVSSPPVISWSAPAPAPAAAVSSPPAVSSPEPAAESSPSTRPPRSKRQGP